MGLNPLKKLNELKASLPDPKVFAAISKNSHQQIQTQVNEILKQTVLMERWAIASEAIAEQLDRIAVSLEELAKK